MAEKIILTVTENNFVVAITQQRIGPVTGASRHSQPLKSGAVKLFNQPGQMICLIGWLQHHTLVPVLVCVMIKYISADTWQYGRERCLNCKWALFEFITHEQTHGENSCSKCCEPYCQYRKSIMQVYLRHTHLDFACPINSTWVGYEKALKDHDECFSYSLKWLKINS